MSLEGRIRERAYYLWEREGRPFGRDVELWHQASQEIAAERAEPLPEADLAPEPAVVAPDSVPAIEAVPEPLAAASLAAVDLTAPPMAAEPIKPARKPAAGRKPAAAKTAPASDPESVAAVKKRAPRKPKTPAGDA